jgi:hypothetical protein
VLTTSIVQTLFSSLKTLIISCILIGAISFQGFAQSPQQWKKHGDKSLEENDIYGAVFYYKKALEADSISLDLWMDYALAQRLSNNYQQAALAYSHVYNDPYRTKHDIALYWWAKMQQNLGEYEDAAHNFKNFENYHSVRGSKEQKDAKMQTKACIWAMKHLNDTSVKDLRNFGVDLNSSYAEFGGSLINDSTLIYSSLQYNKKDSSLKLAKSELNNRVMLYKAVKRDSIWFDEGPLDSLINVKGKHTANAMWSANKQWLLYSSCDNYNQCAIYYSELVNGDFTPPEKFSESINLEGFNTTQPYLTEFNDKLTLFFVSNRPQGQGGLDIWYSQYNNRLMGFTFPRNMGRKVNSPGNEISPFFLKDSSRLYFSSNYHMGYGGYDVFSSSVTSLRSARPPKNLGLLVNSSANDMYYATYPADSLSFITSNREGGIKLKNATCCNDIYYFKHEPMAVPDTVVDSVETIPVVETIEELNNYLPVLYFHNDRPDPRSWKTTTKKSYLVSYNDYLGMKKHYLKEYTKNKTGIERDSAIYRLDNFFKTKIEKGIEDFDLFMDLLFVQLERGKSVLITIKGYASPLAKSDYNINLTQRRIQSLINYLYEYKNGELKAYLDGTAANGGKITFEKIPYGESKTSRTTSDDLSDKINSVYSPDAMEERRIEILHIESQNNN